MIAADLDIGWIYFGGTAAEQNVLSGGLEEVVVKLERGNGFVAPAATGGGCVGAFSGARDAIQAANVGVDESNHVRAVEDSNPVAYFPAIGGMNPVAIKDDVVSMFGGHNTADVDVRRCSPLNSNEADVISDGCARRTPHHQDGEQLGRATGGLSVGRTPGQTGDSAPCGRDARAFEGEFGVGRVGSYRDVVLVVAFFRGQNLHVERGSGGQKQRVSALGAVDGGGQIRLGGDANLFSGRGRSVERSVVTGFGKFGDAVFGAKLRDIALTAIGGFSDERCNRQTRQRGPDDKSGKQTEKMKSFRPRAFHHGNKASGSQRKRRHVSVSPHHVYRT